MKKPIASLVVLLVLSAPALAAAAKRITVKMGTVAPEDTPWSQLAYRIRSRIHKKSKKKFRVKIYLSGVLGDEKSLVRQCEAGTLQMIGVSTAAMSAVVPELQALELPYLFRSNKEVDYVLDALYDDFAELLKHRGFILAYWAQNGWRNFGVGKDETPILTPEDLQGREMRSQESLVHVKMYEVLGARPKALPVTEVLSALNTKLVKGLDNTALFTFATSWYQGLSHYTLSRHIFQPAVLVYSRKWWDSVKEQLKVSDEELRAMLVPQRDKLTRWGRRKVRRLRKGLLANFAAAGIKLHKLGKKQRKRFAKATRKVHRIYRERVGDAGKALLAKIYAKRKEFRSR